MAFHICDYAVCIRFDRVIFLPTYVNRSCFNSDLNLNTSSLGIFLHQCLWFFIIVLPTQHRVESNRFSSTISENFMFFWPCFMNWLYIKLFKPNDIYIYIYVVPHRYPPDAAFYIFIQQIYILNILNMLHNLRFFSSKMPFIS